VSDRQAWLEEWCPQCRAAPGRRCGEHRFKLDRSAIRFLASPGLHVARGWSGRACPTCRASAGERCRTPTGREASRIHLARLRPARGELFGVAVWDALDGHGVAVASVPFSGRSGRAGEIDGIRYSRREGEVLVELERWMPHDELAYALEAPVWDRYGTFAGHPPIRGLVTWNSESRLAVISGTRGGERFEEIAR
jgi:hypothetical protein